MSKSKKVTIGYKYYLGLHMVAVQDAQELLEIQVGERTAWSGSVTSNQSISIDAENLFGGEKKEGGVKGTLDVMFGGSTQPKNSYLTNLLGNVIPAFRGVVSFVFRGGLVCAMSPYPKAWAFKLRNIPQQSWYSETANIGNGANGAHIIREVLLNKKWGMGHESDAIDDASFRSVALQLHTEGLGLSFELTSTDSIENFIYTVVQHINGMFYTKPDTGKFALKLLREDYTVSSLPVFDESNIITLESFERPSYAEMVNEIVVTYRPQGKADDDSVTVQDLAAIAAQEGIISQSVSYPGIDTATNAARVAMRDLRQKSTPLARVKLKVFRSAWNTSIGDCIKFTWSEHGVSNMVLRVLGINTGTINSGEISIDAIEDVFGLPNSTYIGSQTSQWTNPMMNPTTALYRKVLEATYWDLKREMSAADFSYLTNTSAFVTLLIGQPSDPSINYELWTRPNTGDFTYAEDGNFAPHCLLTNAVTPSTTNLICDTFRGDIDKVVIGGYGYLDNEIVRIDSINEDTGSVVVGRGCLDTVPADHNATARLFFVDSFLSADPTEYATSETINAKALVRTGTGLLDLSSAAQDNITMVGRFAKPYPPGNLKLNNVSYPTTITDDLVITWSHRDRTQQLATIIDTTSGNIGPEPGTTYGIEIRKVSDNSLLESQSSIVGTTFLSGLHLSNTPVRVIVWSTVSGQRSYQSHSYKFTLNNR